MDKMQYQVIVMESGEQIPVESPDSVIAGGFYIGADRPKEVITLDVTEAEFTVIKQQAIDNAIPEEVLRSKSKTSEEKLEPYS